MWGPIQLPRCGLFAYCHPCGPPETAEPTADYAAQIRAVRKYFNARSRCAIRAGTVHVWTEFKPFELTLNEEQIPQMIENNKNQGARWTRWKDFFCAQGRCATRLRYAPTVLRVFTNSTLQPL